MDPVSHTELSHPAQNLPAQNRPISGAMLGVILGIVGLAHRSTRSGAAVPAIVCLLLLIGYAVFATVGPSLFFS